MPSAAAGLNWPGVRTLRSERFRIVLAITLWVAASTVLGLVLARQAASPTGQYGFDFAVYYEAAGTVAAGGSPYGPAMFEGPVPAQGVYIFKYAPPFAQMLVPLTALDLATATGVWVVIQAALIFAGLWLAVRAGGAPRTVETVCWVGVAATLFLPNFDTLWKGNVSGALAFTIGLTLAGAVRGGGGVAVAALLKTTPVVLLPATVAAGRSAWLGAALLAPVVAVSFLLAPAAWIDFVRVLPNLVAGDARFATNISPDNLLAYALPAAPFAAEVVRWLSLAAGVLAIVGSVFLARRPGGWPAAVTLGVAAMLLLPSSNWYHYLCVLLPLAAFAWPRAGRGPRAGLLGGAACVSVAVAVLPLAVAGSVLMIGASLFALWPRPAPARLSAPAA